MIWLFTNCIISLVFIYLEKKIFELVRKACWCLTVSLISLLLSFFLSLMFCSACTSSPDHMHSTFLSPLALFFLTPVTFVSYGNFCILWNDPKSLHAHFFLYLSFCSASFRGPCPFAFPWHISTLPMSFQEAERPHIFNSSLVFNPKNYIGSILAKKKTFFFCETPMQHNILILTLHVLFCFHHSVES